MFRWMSAFVLIACVSQGSILAFCPSGNPDEILCEDFDTYCSPAQYPGGAGVSKGTVCAPDAAKPVNGDELLRTVWDPTSSCVPIDWTTNPPTVRSDLPTPQLLLDNSPLTNNPGMYYANSRPFAARSPSQSEKTVGDGLPQHTFKDWSTGEYNISRFVSNKFGSQFRGVMGTDANPLVLTFMLDSKEAGKIFYSNGFIELGYGDPSDHLNRANTDFALSPNCGVACNGNPARVVQYPMICDIWNPVNGIRFVGCPNPTEILPPKRNALAIGLLSIISVLNADIGPCACGSSTNHGGENIHPVMFNGQVWFDFRNTTPVAGCIHTLTDMSGNAAAVPLTADGQINAPLHNAANREFVLWQSPLKPDGKASGSPQNWLTLTIKSNTAKVKLYKIITTLSEPATQYQVTDELDNIPLAYSGPFDSIRLGVGPGCRLAGNNSWECAPDSTRTCVVQKHEQGAFAEFDDISLYGGKGWSPAGACCLSPSGVCLDEQMPEDCDAEGGTHKGGATSCSDPDIYCCPIPYADADGDQDVDADDFAALQVCYSGTKTATGKCLCFDRNGDKKIDQVDVAMFANCATGPGVVIAGECP